MNLSLLAGVFCVMGSLVPACYAIWFRLQGERGYSRLMTGGAIVCVLLGVLNFWIWKT